MPETLDIQKVISTSTSNVSIDDLTRKGFKQVKVLNQALITKLIGEAVDRVLLDRSKAITRDERDKVIKEARTQFEDLAKQRLEKERSRIDELAAANGALKAELETLRKRLAATVEVQAARDQALARTAALETELSGRKAELDRLAAEAHRAREAEKALEALRARLEAVEAAASHREAEASRLRSELGESQRHAGLLEGQLAARTEELEKGRAAPASEAVMEKLLEKIGDKLGKAAQPADVSKIMLSLDGLSRRLASLGSGGAGGAGAGPDGELTAEFALGALFDTEKVEAVESNVSKVKVKETQATGVKGALARLKKLQQGGADGE
ncbi:MAG: hypothetical protein HY721_03980 [Planctomycetes bacterium]|nr:hypothetical protein [Planctomycetota bacterium]